jgi:hypothetical protein
VQVTYAKHTAGPQSPRLAGQPTDLVRATEVQRQAADSPAYGLKAGDRLANFRVPVLDRESLGAATADYAEVLRASEEELRRDFGGKCVLICNWRTGPLAVQLTKSRKEHGSYVHATALELLSRGTGVRVLTPPYTLLWTGVIGLLGLAVGVHFERRLTARIACLSLLSVALAAACLIAALRYGVLYHPFIAILALVIPAELSAATRRLRRV